jgi:cyclase
MKSKLYVIAFFLLFSIITKSQQVDVPPITVEKLSDNLFQLTGGRGANSGMYIGESGVLLIDSKMDKASVEGILIAVEGFTDKPVTYLVNTHSDGDHVNGNEFLPKEVVIIAHENCRDEFFHPGRDGSPSKWNDEKLKRFTPQITFTDKMLLHMGEEPVELHYFGIGHTTGDIVVYFPEEKVAFIGDQVFFERPQLIHSYKGGNSFEHVKTTERILESLDAVKYCSGHSDIKTREDMIQHLKEMKQLQDKIQSLVKEEKSLEEIQAGFKPEESRLVETIYSEIKGNSL